MDRRSLGLCLLLGACGSGSSPHDGAIEHDLAGVDLTGVDLAGATGDLASGVPDGGCPYTVDTTPTDTVNANLCHVLDRDTSSCMASRTTAGLSGVWLQFSCRVSLSKSGGTIVAASDGNPDYKSNYFPTTSACWESYTGGVQNPNFIATKAYSVPFPTAPNTTTTQMQGAIVGLALNGVPIFGNFAAPGDDIFFEAMTFDRCGGHPTPTSAYHYHCEPYALTYDDDRLVGVLRDGYPVYGRRDADGSLPTDLDAHGGHTGTTPDSPSTGVYHYHVNLQTSSGQQTAGEQAWFLTTGTYRGAPAPCSDCN